MAKPIVAIIGKPNVGKSTFFNYIVGKRISIVEDTPGVTRDRVYGEANWRGREFTLIDTGGIEPESNDEILVQMRAQANIAIDIADVIIFMTDIKQGVTAADEDIAIMLKKARKPVVLVCNKSDSFGKVEDEIYEFYNLGLGDPYAISATNAKGLGDVLDAVYENFPEEKEEEDLGTEIKVAVIGKPNVGKSSLINKILGENRVIVSNIAGTTRDVVEGSVTVDGILLNMIDTAGIRETDNIVESLGVEKSKEMIKKADLVLLVIDGSKELDQEDQKLLELTEDTNRIIIINKADLGKKVDLEGIEISAKEQDILALTKEIKKKFNLGLMSNQEEYYLTNARQTQLLEKAASSLQIAIDAMKMSIPSDLIVEDLYDSWSCLKEILGEQAKEDLLDELFKRFCIGK